MSRYTGPCRIRIHGPQGVGAGYVGLARKLLGEQMAIHVDAYDSSRGLASQSQISKTYKPKPTEQIARKASLPNGVDIRVQYNTYMPVIDIWVPEGAEPVKAIEYRGLLRALQDVVNPCESLEEPTEEEVGQVSELHPLYDPTDPEQQWLVYPDDGLSAEFNTYPNYPLPPRGGTFIMDMIGLPFNGQAFQGKPPLSACKMLVTGGGTIDDLEWVNPTPELKNRITNKKSIVGGVEFICPPRKFRVGRMDEMPGWPWVDRRDPGNTFIRLVSISARMEVFSVTKYESCKAYFTIEFLKLNGEPFDPSDAAYLEPVEFELTGFTGSIFNSPWWYDFSVTSLTSDGSKVVLGLHDAFEEDFKGVCYDFVVLDFTLNDFLAPEFVRHISKYDHLAINRTNQSVSSSGEVSFPVIKVGSILSGPENNMVAAQIAVTTATTDNDGNTYPETVTSSKTLVSENTHYVAFDAENRLVRTFLRTTTVRTTTNTVLGYSFDPGTNTTLDGLVMLLYQGAKRDDTYTFRIGDVVMTPTFNVVGWVDNYFVCVQDHVFGTQAATLSGQPQVDANPDYWRFVYGRRRLADGTLDSCKWQTWNGFVTLTPGVGEPPTCEDEANNKLALGEYGVCNNVFYIRTAAGVIQGFPSLADWGGGHSVSEWVTTVADRRLDDTVTSSFSFFRVVMDDDEAVPELLGELTFSRTNSSISQHRTRIPLGCSVGFGHHDTTTDNISASLLSWVTQSTGNSSNTHAVEIDWEADPPPPEPVIWDGPTYDSVSSSASRFATPDTTCAFSSGTSGFFWLTPSNGTITNNMLQPVTPSNDTTETAVPEEFLWSGGQIDVNRLGGTVSVNVFPLDGIGLYLFTAMDANASAGVNNCGEAPPSEAGPRIQLDGVPVAFSTGHLLYDYGTQVFVNPVFTDYTWEVLPRFPITATAVAAPASYVYTHDVPPNNGVLLRPVLGPERGYCSLQQISYTGWVYPQEKQLPE